MAKKRKQAAIPSVNDRKRIKELNAFTKKARREIKVAERARDELVKKYMARLRKDWALPTRKVAERDWPYDYYEAKAHLKALLDEVEKTLRAGLTHASFCWPRDTQAFSPMASAIVCKAQEQKGKKAEIKSKSYKKKTGSYHVDRWGSKDEWTTYYEITLEIEL